MALRMMGMEMKLIGGQKVQSLEFFRIKCILLFRAKFQKFQQCLVDQFNSYCYSDDIGCVDGTNTLSENAADLAGLKIAFEAFNKLPKQRLSKAPMFTSDQVSCLRLKL